MSYRISVPIVIHERSDKEAILNELKQCGAERVFLAVGILSVNPEKTEIDLARLRTMIPYFQANGIEVGIWFWTFWRSDLDYNNTDDYLMVNSEGQKRLSETSLESNVKNYSGFACPASERFVDEAMDTIRKFAELGADVLMFDDDFRFGFLDSHPGCFCNAHLRMTAKKLGRDSISREELVKAVYADAPSPERTAHRNAMGESLENFARRVRETVDSVNPNIRFALCSVMSLWDMDGTDSVTIAKLLAGKTKPLLRLIGAPYWAVGKSWGNRLQNVIELERMESAWCEEMGVELETMTEGDVFPRPRHRVPSAYLEGFDTALRAAGVGTGILKYMMDYTSSATYETGYRTRSVKNAPVYAAIEQMFAQKPSVGVRVYESMNKINDADFSGIEKREEYVANLFFSPAARMLSDNSIPTMYRGNNGAGIAFGENARHLPEDALQNGLILDIRAAKILMEQGVDVGLESIGEPMMNNLLFFPEEQEYIRTFYQSNTAYNMVPKASAEILVTSCTNDRTAPDVIRYENATGQRFLVFAFDAAFTDEARWRNYCTQNLLFREIEWLSGKKLPVKCAGNPDLYVQCKQDESGLTIGLWNFFADEIEAPELELNRAYTEAEFINCTGTLCGDRLILSQIEPFHFAFVSLQ